MKNGIPNHVAIIMDGNGRWATRQGKKRTDGHYAGYKTLKNTAFQRQRQERLFLVPRGRSDRAPSDGLDG